MKNSYIKPAALFLVVGAALFVTSLAIFNFEVYCNWAFICRNTGSRKGYRQWFFGVQTGHWHNESALEKFIKNGIQMT